MYMIVGLVFVDRLHLARSKGDSQMVIRLVFWCSRSGSVVDTGICAVLETRKR